jgi:hypothetical protein
MCPIIAVRDREGALAEPWLRVQLEQPGVLLLRRLGSGGLRGVAVAMLDTLVWACSSADERVFFITPGSRQRLPVPGLICTKSRIIPGGNEQVSLSA